MASVSTKAKLSVMITISDDTTTRSFTVGEGDVINGLSYTENGVIKTISGVVRIIQYVQTTKQTTAVATTNCYCKRGSQFAENFRVTSLVIDSSDIYNADVNVIPVNSITDVESVNVSALGVSDVVLSDDMKVSFKCDVVPDSVLWNNEVVAVVRGDDDTYTVEVPTMYTENELRIFSEDTFFTTRLDGITPDADRPECIQNAIIAATQKLKTYLASAGVAEPEEAFDESELNVLIATGVGAADEISINDTTYVDGQVEVANVVAGDYYDMISYVAYEVNEDNELLIAAPILVDQAAANGGTVSINVNGFQIDMTIFEDNTLGMLSAEPAGGLDGYENSVTNGTASFTHNYQDTSAYAQVNLGSSGVAISDDDITYLKLEDDNGIVAFIGQVGSLTKLVSGGILYAPDEEGVPFLSTEECETTTYNLTYTIPVLGTTAIEATSVETVKTVENPSATVGDASFATVSDAVTACKNGETVVLQADIQEDLVIPQDGNVVIDLNGTTISNNTLGRAVAGHTIINNGYLEITGDGVIDNVTHQKAALLNNDGATVVLSGGVFRRSLENGISATDSGGNSYYAIVNHGEMIINEGTLVEQNGHFSSMIENGWYDGSTNTSMQPSKLTINGGTFTGGLNTIKNDDYGELVINGGTFNNTSQAALLNWNVAEINGGAFDSTGDAILNGYLNDTMDKGQLTINGGTFTAGEGKSSIAKMGGSKSIGTIVVSGGDFSTEIDATYLASGTSCVQDAETGRYKVQ